jgi:hypothetical protein
MPKQNLYLIKENYKKTETVQELKDEYKVLSFEEFMKTYEPSEEVEILTEAEYQDRVLHGSQFGPGNGQSINGRVYLDARYLPVLGLGAGTLALTANRPRNSQNFPSYTPPTLETKTV